MQFQKGGELLSQKNPKLNELFLITSQLKAYGKNSSYDNTVRSSLPCVYVHIVSAVPALFFNSPGVTGSSEPTDMGTGRAASTHNQ